jgi:cytochrome P450
VTPPAKDLMRQVADPARRPDPYPVYAELRRERVNHVADGSYALARYQDVVSLLHDPRISSDAHNAADQSAQPVRENSPFIQRDPPDHDRLRAIAMRYFGPPSSPGMVAGQEPEIQKFVEGLAADLPKNGTADLVDQFAYPLPVSVICGLLGVPPQDESQFRVWTEGIVKGLDAQEQEGADELIALRDKCQAEMFVYVNGLIGQHREHPDGSMLSHLANDSDAMTDAELGTTSVLLLIAGHETTVNLTANGILTLLRHPAMLERLRAEPQWAMAVVEELLRYEPPVQYLPNRFALEDIQVGSVTIPRGARLILLLAAAGRDPERFDHPDRFDPDRADNEHLGFGSGIHYCFGAPLARLEAAHSLTTLARRLVSPRLASDPPPYRPSPVLRGPVHLPVTYDNLRN